jgi:NADH pyrophosphatase NudC (nudix superfamily)
MDSIVEKIIVERNKAIDNAIVMECAAIAEENLFSVQINPDKICSALKLLEKAEQGLIRLPAYGEWRINCDGYYPYCSNCGTEPKNGVMSNFCPECGAYMKGAKK